MYQISLGVGSTTSHPFLEKDHPSRNLGEGSKPMEPKGRKDKEEEEDRFLM